MSGLIWNGMSETEYEQWKASLKDAFLSDLREVMRKHGVESITADDHFQGYAECGEDIRMTVEISHDEDGSGNTVRPFVEIDLGKGFYTEPLQRSAEQKGEA
jgi:hypothetical protein